jgi:hypothetical protein
MTMQSTPSEFEQDLRQPFIDVEVDSWRFSKLFSRVLGRLEASDSARYANQLR